MPSKWFIIYYVNKDGKCLIDYYQLDISRIAAFRSLDYKREFVYIVTKAEQATRLYDKNPEELEERKTRMIKEFGFAWEEYGILGEKLITRAEYDDGAAVIEGKVVEATDAKLRLRYNTPYNFIIASNGSPISNQKFDKINEEFLNDILQGKHTLEEYLETALKFEHDD